MCLIFVHSLTVYTGVTGFELSRFKRERSSSTEAEEESRINLRGKIKEGGESWMEEERK